jgi:hypothetical protein
VRGWLVIYCHWRSSRWNEKLFINWWSFFDSSGCEVWGNTPKLLSCHKNIFVESYRWIFSWAMSHICANDEYRSQALQTDRKTSSFMTLVSSLSRPFASKVVDVFSFPLQICHWFIAPPSRRYFQGHSSWENPRPLPREEFV